MLPVHGEIMMIQQFFVCALALFYVMISTVDYLLQGVMLDVFHIYLKTITYITPPLTTTSKSIPLSFNHHLDIRHQIHKMESAKQKFQEAVEKTRAPGGK